MHNPRLAGRYAKSLIDLAIEKGQLEEVYSDMLWLQSACRTNRDFLNLLRSPVIRPDKKTAILESIAAGRLTELTAGFNRLLVRKSREAFLPEIITAFIAQYKAYKGIHTVRLTTATPASEALKQQIIDTVQQQTALKNIELETNVDESIIGGFRLEIGDSLVDASILYDLSKIKAQFLNNDFVFNIR